MKNKSTKKSKDFSFEYIGTIGDFDASVQAADFWLRICKKADLQLRTAASRKWHDEDRGVFARNCTDALDAIAERKENLLDGSEKIGGEADADLDPLADIEHYTYDPTILKVIGTQTVIDYTSCSFCPLYDADEAKRDGDEDEYAEKIGSQLVPIWNDRQRERFLKAEQLPKAALDALTSPHCTLRHTEYFRLKEAKDRKAVVEALCELFRLYAARSLDLGDLTLAENFARGEIAVQSLTSTDDRVQDNLSEVPEMQCIERVLLSDIPRLAALIRLRTYPKWGKS